MNPLQSLAEYERFIYTLQQRFPTILRSTLVVIRRSDLAARLHGELEIGPYRLVVREKLLFLTRPGRITSYGYEIWRGDEKVYWYDSQPHPNDPALAATDPHHKHIPPDIKHHRIPAPELSFTRPNLPFLIREIGSLLTALEA
ncbi:MAG TPA: hypothetical protein ENJ31_12550 [Anaerolineae bacterium]|nr:hypothetical protein [Anaerolineae bacterium]